MLAEASMPCTADLTWVETMWRSRTCSVDKGVESTGLCGASVTIALQHQALGKLFFGVRGKHFWELSRWPKPEGRQGLDDTALLANPESSLPGRRGHISLPGPL